MEGRRHIVVSGGAGFWSGDEGRALDEFALSLTGKARPRVCYIPTAAGDDQACIDGFEAAFGATCQTSYLTTFRTPERPPTAMLAEVDAVFVSGGSTPNLVAVWRAHGIDRLLRECWERGVVLAGSSAGGLCWFESGVVDSLSLDGSLRPFSNLLGFLPGSHCPHYNEEPGRRPAYLDLVGRGSLPPGIAVDEFAAVHFEGTSVASVFSAQPSSTAYRVWRDGHEVREERLA